MVAPLRCTWPTTSRTKILFTVAVSGTTFKYFLKSKGAFQLISLNLAGIMGGPVCALLHHTACVAILVAIAHDLMRYSRVRDQPPERPRRKLASTWPGAMSVLTA